MNEQYKCNNYELFILYYINLLRRYISQQMQQKTYQLFIFKDGVNNAGLETPRQIIDYISEGVNEVGGALNVNDDNKPNSYTFKITDYISELLAGNTDNLPALGVRVLNPTDLPTSSVDTIVRNYNWNPKAITLLNNNTQNESRKPKLKISYSLKTDEE